MHQHCFLLRAVCGKILQCAFGVAPRHLGLRVILLSRALPLTKHTTNVCPIRLYPSITCSTLDTGSVNRTRWGTNNFAHTSPPNFDTFSRQRTAAQLRLVAPKPAGSHRSLASPIFLRILLRTALFPVCLGGHLPLTLSVSGSIWRTNRLSLDRLRRRFID